MIPLEGGNTLPLLRKLGWSAVLKTADLAFKGMEYVDQFNYQSLSLQNPEATRPHKLPIAEQLYGLHLKTRNQFNQFIGQMKNPIITACNGFGETVLHAFLLFFNSINGEYNALHIRQGSYYPEFMNREQIINYFTTENKKILGALSLRTLAEQYGATLNTKKLRIIYRDRMPQKNVPYRFSDQNCMTFCVLAFAATTLDIEEFLERVGLRTFQSPYHIFQALAVSEKNHPALHSPDKNNMSLLPNWLTQLNQSVSNDEP